MHTTNIFHAVRCMRGRRGMRCWRWRKMKCVCVCECTTRHDALKLCLLWMALTFFSLFSVRPINRWLRFLMGSPIMTQQSLANGVDSERRQCCVCSGLSNICLNKNDNGKCSPANIENGLFIGSHWFAVIQMVWPGQLPILNVQQNLQPNRWSCCLCHFHSTFMILIKIWYTIMSIY